MIQFAEIYLLTYMFISKYSTVKKSRVSNKYIFLILLLSKGTLNWSQVKN